MTERVAFVTGGMGGIGTAICQRLRVERQQGRRQLPARLRQEGRVAGAHARARATACYAAEGNVEDFDSCADMFYRISSTSARSISW